MIKIIFQKLKPHWLNKKGSTSAILLASMVSLGSLGAIYYTQRNLGDILSGMSQSMEDWERVLVMQSAQTLGGYLVANNLVLCREGGWSDKKSKCRWRKPTEGDTTEEDTTEEDTTEEDTTKDDFKDFHLSNMKDTEEGLVFDSKYQMEGGEWKKYKISFDLQNWKTNQVVKNLIGDIPKYVCRSKTDMSLLEDGICPLYEDSSDPTNQKCTNKANSICEYISAVDGDYHIVLIKVELTATSSALSDVSRTYTAFSAIRRPLAMVVFEDASAKEQCPMFCNTGEGTRLTPECRGELALSAPGQVNKYSNIITIKNAGPGSIYKLSFISEITDRLTPVVDGETPKKETEVTPDVLAASEREVLFPGEKLKVEYVYKCPSTIQVNTQTMGGGIRGARRHSVRNEMVSFQDLSYSFSLSTEVESTEVESAERSADNSVSACYKSPVKTKVSKDENGEKTLVIDEDLERQSESSCSQSTPLCKKGSSGTCRYTATIEPQRLFISPLSVSAENKQIVRTVTTVVRTGCN